MIGPMFDPRCDLLSLFLAPLAAGDHDDWQAARDAVEAADEGESDLAVIVELEDREALAELLAGWTDGSVLRTVHERGVLKRAVKAFRKRLKLVRLDDESRIGGAFSSGSRSGIVAIEPPVDQFPPEVWAELVRQGRLVQSDRRQLELPPDAP